MTKFLLALKAAMFSVILTGCGSASDEPKANQAQVPASVESVQADVAVPQKVIIRMPLDAQGKPTGAPEMRVINAATDLTSADAVSAAWDSGEVPANLTTNLDELDRDSSVQSWYWNRWHWGNNWGGFGWNRFAPRLGWGGNYWNYGYVNNWNWNGYGYGCFNRGWW